MTSVCTLPRHALSQRLDRRRRNEIEKDFSGPTSQEIPVQCFNRLLRGITIEKLKSANGGFHSVGR